MNLHHRTSLTTLDALPIIISTGSTCLVTLWALPRIPYTAYLSLSKFFNFSHSHENTSVIKHVTPFLSIPVLGERTCSEDNLNPPPLISRYSPVYYISVLSLRGVY